MNIRLVFALLVYVLCSQKAASNGNNKSRSLRDSYILDRLHLTDKTLIRVVERVESLEAGKTDVCTDRGWCVMFDFESGIHGWTLTGKAFDNQPTYGDNPLARGVPSSNNHGNWWIGGYENRQSESAKAGATQGDRPQGSMTSPPFKIKGNKLRFLIGGGCDMKMERVELLIGKKVVAKATGKCIETMEAHTWQIHGAYKGKIARVRLVDSNSGGWGHINFDHFEMLCSQ